MTRIKKAFVGAAAATAMAVSATPAAAKDRYDNDKIGAGEIIAGALIIGGIAAVLSSKDSKDDRYYSRDRRGYNNGYGYGNKRVGSRKAVNRCVRRAERGASRYGRANVTQIRDIKRTRYGYRVKGRIEVSDGYRGGRYNRGYRDIDRGKFTCFVDQGRVADIRYKGLSFR